MKVRAYETAVNLKCNGYQKGLESFLIRKQNQEVNVKEVLGQELHKPMIKKFKRRNMYAWFKDNTQAADLVEMELFSYIIIQYPLCAIDVFSKYS